jgi:hypothetical protein
MHTMKLKIAWKTPWYTLVVDEISSYCCVSDKVFALLCCYSPYIGSCFLMLLESLLVPSSRIPYPEVVTNRLSQKSFQYTTSPVKGPLKMGLIGSPETLVNSYQHMLCNN